MNPARVLQYFDRIGEAPDAIPCLRRFVLHVAVRGELVDQDPEDGTQSQTGTRKLGVANTGAPLLPAATPGPRPFVIPASWTWVAISEAAYVEMGQSPASEHYNQSRDGLPFYQGKSDFGRRHPTPRYWCDRPSKTARKDDILISVRAPVGPTNVANEECCIGRGLAAIRPNARVDREFLLLCLKSFEDDLAALGFGTTFVAINKKQLSSFPIPLPPLAEQARIVAKVDELMALCDRLEAAQTERERRRDLVVAASLKRLNQPVAEAKAFREHAGFQLEHLTRLVTRRQHVEQLRQAILSLAVRGQLVPHDPTAWFVAPLEEVAANIVDCPHSTPKWVESGKICVRTNQFRPGRLDLSNVRFVSESTYVERIERLRPMEDDILYSREGGILGIACRVPPKTELCLGQRMMLIRASESMNPVFLELVLNSPLITEIARTKTTGGAAPRVNVATVKAYPIPVPPLVEQEQIVAKVAELITICDRLEASLAAEQFESRRLLEAVLHLALATRSDSGPTVGAELASV